MEAAPQQMGPTWFWSRVPVPSRRAMAASCGILAAFVHFAFGAILLPLALYLIPARHRLHMAI